MEQCPSCSHELPGDARFCPWCLSEVTPRTDDGASGIPKADPEIPTDWQSAAMYELELPARCPHCDETIRSVMVLRLRRAQVPFTSTLPRGGRVMVCPECERIVSGELSGLI